MMPSPPLNTRLLDAAKKGDLLALQRLIPLGADPQTKDVDGMTALHWTAYNGHADCLAFLLPLSHPNRPDVEGSTALHCAAKRGEADCLRLLLPASDPNTCDLEGCTALHWSALMGYPDCLRLLLPVSNPDIQNSDDGSTALHSAAVLGHLDGVSLLLPLSDLALHDHEGRTALDLCVHNHWTDCVDLIQAFLLAQSEHKSLNRSTWSAPASSKKSPL